MALCFEYLILVFLIVFVVNIFLAVFRGWYWSVDWSICIVCVGSLVLVCFFEVCFDEEGNG